MAFFKKTTGKDEQNGGSNWAEKKRVLCNFQTYGKLSCAPLLGQRFTGYEDIC